MLCSDASMYYGRKSQGTAASWMKKRHKMWKGQLCCMLSFVGYFHSTEDFPFGGKVSVA